MNLRDIARLLNAVVEGADSADIVRVAKIEEAEKGDITFIANPKYARYLETTRASAVIVGRTLGEGVAKAGGTALLRVEDPYSAFLKVLVAFHPPAPPLPPGIHATAVIDPSVTLGVDVRIGACAVIDPGCRIGDRAMIGQGTVLGSGVDVGEDSLLYANVTVREGCRIGARVIIHSGTVIGSDGFGFAPQPDGSFEKIPQLGIVVIGDDVEIGANCAVDRATMGETRIEKGAKLDNLIQVAHNVVIGEHTVIAAQTGVSGSTKIGKHVMIGGQVGFTGHLEIADRTKFGAQSGVHRSVTTPGATLLGYPAIPQREALRLMAALTHIPDALAAIRELQTTVDRLTKQVEALRSSHG